MFGEAVSWLRHDGIHQTGSVNCSKFSVNVTTWSFYEFCPSSWSMKTWWRHNSTDRRWDCVRIFLWKSPLGGAINVIEQLLLDRWRHVIDGIHETDTNVIGLKFLCCRWACWYAPGCWFAAPPCTWCRARDLSTSSTSRATSRTTRANAPRRASCRRRRRRAPLATTA